MVWLTPLLPFINDTVENVQSILEECARVGVRGIVSFGMGLTLRDGDREYFYAALDKHFPGMKERYIQTYRNAYELPSPNQKELMELLHRICEERGMLHSDWETFDFLREFPEKYQQMSLFDM